MNLAHWLVRSGKLHPRSPALFEGTRQIADYGAFARSAASIAAGLAGHGVAPGDRVAIFAANSPRYLQTMYGVWHAGAAVVPVNAKLHARETAWIVANSDASIVFVSGAQATELAECLPAGGPLLIDLDSADFDALLGAEAMTQPVDRAGDDLAWLFYTSGTTGKPKGVRITNANIHAMAFSYFVDVDEVRPGDAALYAAPLSHGAGLYNVQHVLRAARHVFPPSGGFDPAEILAIARELREIHMFAAPTMVRRLVDAARAAGEDGDGIRTIVYGGGPMYLADIEDAVEVLGDRFVQIYGQGECPMCITALPRERVRDRTHERWRERLASVGCAQSCVEVRIAAPDGRFLEPGETGEIVVRGAAVMAGYWNDPAATASALRDGWLWTGDVGTLDADGFLTLMDRSKDLIISGGSNIYPREVEEVLLTHPGVREVSVVGAPDPEWGETVVAFVVAAPGGGVGPAELDAHCLSRIARFKRPKTYRIVRELPKNNYGKVLKTELREMLKKGENA